MTEKLLPCPFCGGEAFVSTVEHPPENRPNGYRFHGQIICKKCQATAGTTGFDLTHEEATKKAIAAWNRRSDAVPVVRGEWVDVYDGTYRKRRCSLCGRDYMMILDYNFCPNCGTDMRANP